MTDTKISDLNAASALVGTEVLPVVQSGATKKATANQLSTVSREGVVSIFDFMSAAEIASVKARNLSSDVTTAINNAIGSFSSGDGTVYFPPGKYKVTGTISVTHGGIHLRGAGVYATYIDFAPTATDVLFDFTAGASILFNASLTDMTLSSSDSTYCKTGVRAVDCSGFVMRDVVVSPTNWTGADSIGLHLCGREIGTISNVQLGADRPLLIDVNPNNAISIDHYVFTNCYLQANSHPCVEIATGVNLSNVAFNGHQAWVGGTGGLYWNDTTASVASYNLVLENVRTEQGTDNTKYDVYIAHNSNLQDFRVQSCYFAADRKGLYLRNIWNASLRDSAYTNAREALNIVGVSGTALDIRSCVWNGSSTVSMTDMSHQLSMKKTSGPIAETAYYVYDANTLMKLGKGETKVQNYSGSLIDDATVDIECGTGYGIGIAIVCAAAHGTTQDAAGTAMCSAGGNFSMGGSASFAVGDVDGKLCVWKDDVIVYVKNRLGETVNYVVTLTCK